MSWGWLTKPNNKGYAPWWLFLWGAIMVGLLTSLFFIPFTWWTIAAVIFFGSMEGVGVATEAPYPPLTDVIHSYLPDWITFPAIYGLVAGAGVQWKVGQSPWTSALLVGLLGWFTIHFIGKYFKHS